MAQFEHGFALLLGVNEHKVAGWSLPTVANDIEAVEQVLGDPARCAYPPGHIKVVRGPETTRQGILDGLDWLHDQIQADTSASVLLLFSGHAWRDDTAQSPAYYLIPYDARQDNLRSRALRVEDFADAIQSLPACRLLIVLDCNHVSGASAQDGQPAAFNAATIPPVLLIGQDHALGVGDGAAGWVALPKGQGRAVISSSQGEQPSFNRQDGSESIFIDHLVEALSGAFQSQPGQREIWVTDVINHVWQCVPQSAQAAWGKTQQVDYQISGQFPVGLFKGGQTAVEPQKESAQAMPAPQVVSYTANTGGGDFTGRDKTVHGDEVRGDKIVGDKVSGDKVAGDSIKVGDISGNGSAIAIGRNAHVSMTTGVSTADLNKAFAPMDQSLRDVPPEKQAEAAQKIDAIKEEAAKGSKANDSRMAKLLDELVSLVPGMVTAVASTFGTPLLGGIVGPVTSFVVDKIRGSK